MIERVKKFIIGGVLVGTLASFGLSFTAPPLPVAAACDGHFLTFPAWYNGITDSTCTPNTSATGGDLTKFIWKIALNIVNIMLQLVGYLCIGYMIYGGWKYLTSAGESDRITSGRKLIMYAAIGLVLSFFAVAIVSLIGGSI